MRGGGAGRLGRQARQGRRCGAGELDCRADVHFPFISQLIGKLKFRQLTLFKHTGNGHKGESDSFILRVMQREIKAQIEYDAFYMIHPPPETSLTLCMRFDSSIISCLLTVKVYFYCCQAKALSPPEKTETTH